MVLTTEDNSCSEHHGDGYFVGKGQWWRLPYKTSVAEEDVVMTRHRRLKNSSTRPLHSKWREPETALSLSTSPSFRSSPKVASSTSGLDFLGHISSYYRTFSSNLCLIRYLFILLLCLNCCSSRGGVSAGTQDYRQLTAVSNDEICPSVDIRNTVESFEQLRNCRVIDGFLQIVLMDRTHESDFANLTYPKLREITGYLLLYRVSGLKSLAHIFPNLSVIKGQDLFMNYAVAVYEMLHLQELGLRSLTDIARGYVFITKNPLLCYVDTIDWSRIIHPNSTTDSNFIAENRAPNACPKCPTSFADRLCGYNNQTKQYLCWNSQYCQRTCPGCSRDRCTDDGECCSPDCLGGCAANGSDQCISCQKFVWNNHCVAKCPNDFYEFIDGRCISAKECYAMPRPDEDTIPPLRPRPWKPFDGKCLIECPADHAETSSDGPNGEKIYTCSKCDGTCRKVCEGANIDSIQAAQRLKGCVVINGSLEIQIRGGGSIVRDLEESLSMVEEITGYLKVVRSLPLVSLNFLQKLKLIRGENLENGKYALVVLDNVNLEYLWDFSNRDNLTLGRGRIFFHFNSKLCLDKIRDLQKRLGITNVDDLEVAPNSNGDKTACNISELFASVASLRHDMVIVTWKPYIHWELRTLLGYVVYYIEAPHLNVTILDGRDGCGNDEWGMIDVEYSEPLTEQQKLDNITTLIPHLKPYTRYAFYVKTYTIASETNGAQSSITYFRTYPATPTPPRSLVLTAISSSDILVQWMPPEQTNGALEKYVVMVEMNKNEDTELLEKRNYCLEPVDLGKRDQLLKEGKRKYLPQSSGDKRDDCPCTKTMGLARASPIKKNEDQVAQLIEFENKLHNSVYIRNSMAQRTVTLPRIIRDRRDISRNTEYTPNSVLLSNELYSNSSKKGELKGSNGTNGTNSTSNETNWTTESNWANETNWMNRDILIYQLSNETLEITIPKLKHFSVYTVIVSACREQVAGEGKRAPNRCSTGKMDTVQTFPLEEADQIDPTSIQWDSTNDTNSAVLRWKTPKETNGKILTYLIQYRRVDIENQQPQTQCVTSHDFENAKNEFVLRKLPAGNYSVIVRATSLAKDSGRWSAPIYFVINESDQMLFRQLLLGALIAFTAIVILGIILCLVVKYFYPDSWYHRKLLFATVNPEYFKPAEGYDKWEISRRKITLDKLLGIGHFGEVYEGRAKGIVQKGVTTKVAIKTLNKSPANQRTWLNFLNEASVMKQFDTHHVVRLLGVVTKGEPLVIMELMAKGDLRTYLRSCRQDVPEEERKVPLQDPPTLREILQMAAEIADGMLYLSDKKFVHRDLAARNCMINAEGTVKIGDFGLTRDVYETDYYRKDSRGHLPVRWMAPESLRDGIFTSRSDVWSYGVVLWEMSTLASLPYTGLGNGEVMPFVINGGVMEVPDGCPPILGEIMKLCWQYKYSQRPMFSEVLEMLLPNVRDDFASVSYYHTEDSRQLRASVAEAIADEDTPYTPLRTNMDDFENFSLDSDDDDEEHEHVHVRENGSCGGHGIGGSCGGGGGDADDDDVDVEQTTVPMLNVNREANNSSRPDTPLHSLSTVNGYIQRPHMIPLVNTKTTPC